MYRIKHIPTGRYFRARFSLWYSITELNKSNENIKRFTSESGRVYAIRSLAQEVLDGINNKQDWTMENLTITLKQIKACMCSCRAHLGSDGKPYWYDIRNKKVYITDCHKKNPVLAIGSFEIKSEKINQF